MTKVLNKIKSLLGLKSKSSSDFKFKGKGWAVGVNSGEIINLNGYGLEYIFRKQANDSLLDVFIGNRRDFLKFVNQFNMIKFKYGFYNVELILDDLKKSPIGSGTQYDAVMKVMEFFTDEEFEFCQIQIKK